MIGSAQFVLVSGERKTDMCPGTWSLVSAGALCLRVVIYRYLDIQNMLAGWG